MFIGVCGLRVPGWRTRDRWYLGRVLNHRWPVDQSRMSVPGFEPTLFRDSRTLYEAAHAVY